MTEFLTLVVAWLGGGALGAIFFGGLWWTVRKGVSSQRPALWFLCSPPLRLSIALAGFYFVSDGHWERLLLCLFGFLLARFAAARLTRLTRGSQTRPAGGASHAP
jgi:F1F0 ATPase subunit 2